MFKSHLETLALNSLESNLVKLDLSTNVQFF